MFRNRLVLVSIKVALSFKSLKWGLMKPTQYINVNVPVVVWISKQDLEAYPRGHTSAHMA